jgi:hypothetical protein
MVQGDLVRQIVQHSRARRMAAVGAAAELAAPHPSAGGRQLSKQTASNEPNVLWLYIQPNGII